MSRSSYHLISRNTIAVASLCVFSHAVDGPSGRLIAGATACFSPSSRMCNVRYSSSRRCGVSDPSSRLSIPSISLRHSLSLLAMGPTCLTVDACKPCKRSLSASINAIAPSPRSNGSRSAHRSFGLCETILLPYITLFMRFWSRSIALRSSLFRC